MVAGAVVERRQSRFRPAGFVAVATVARDGEIPVAKRRGNA